MSVPDDAVDYPGARILKVRDKSILVSAPDLPENPVFGTRERWVPNTCVHDDSEVHAKGDHTGVLLVKKWWAEQEELI